MAKSKKILTQVSDFKSSKGYKDSSEIVMGLDLSLRGTGVAILNDQGELIHRELLRQQDSSKGGVPITYMKFVSNGSMVNREVISSKKSNIDKVKRLLVIKNRIIALIKEFKVTRIMMEGYAMEANRFQQSFGRVFDLGELGGVVKVAIREIGLDIKICSPASLKHFMTAQGHASKEQMIESVNKKYKLSLNDDNEADAYSLAVCLFTLGEQIDLFTKAGGAEAYASYKESKELLKKKASLLNEFSDTEDIKRLQMLLLKEGIPNTKKIFKRHYSLKFNEKFKIDNFEYLLENKVWKPKTKNSFYIIPCYLITMDKNNKEKQVQSYIMIKSDHLNKSAHTREKFIFDILTSKKLTDKDHIKVKINKKFL